jgi:ADP-ribosylation factor-like protein 8
LSFTSLEGVPLLVLGNKNDVEGAMGEQRLIEAMGLRALKDRMVGCYSISAKNIVNIDVTLKWLNNLKGKKA